METGHSRTSAVKTTETVFEVIETLRDLDGATLTELAAELEYATSTVHNHLSTLLELGYVAKEDNRYYLSMRFLSLGNYVQNRKPEYELIKSAIDELANRSKERAAFLTEENFLGSCVYIQGGSNAVQLRMQPGDTLYLHCTAAGKAIMAQMAHEKVVATTDRWGLPELTANTITDEDRLLAELEEIRADEVSYNHQESIDGMVSIGTAIVPAEATEALGAISISGPAHRMESERLDGELRELLLGTANEIELNIDHSMERRQS